MTTTVTNRKPVSRQHHLLPVQSSLPFPTSPALPGRRSKLKDPNLDQASRGATRPGTGPHVRRSMTASSFEGVGRQSAALFQLSIMTTVSESDVRAGKNGRDVSKAANRTHRNIVTSRKKADVTSSTSVVTQPDPPLATQPVQTPTLQLDRPLAIQQDSTLGLEKGGDETRKGGDSDQYQSSLPPFSSGQMADPPPLPQGVFLTSLLFEDSLGDTDPVHSSYSSRDVTSASTRPEDQTKSSKDPLPVALTSSANAAPCTTLATRNTFGLQRVYLEGLDCMRTHVLNVEKSVDAINRQFHKVVTSNSAEGEEKEWLRYLGEVNQRLLEANNLLLKYDVALEVVDSEASLIRLVNHLRAANQPDMVLVDFLTKFWDELKSSTHELQTLLDKFTCTVLHRISSNYMSSQISELQVPVCQRYSQDTTDFQKSLEVKLATASLLLKNYRPALSADLADNKSPFSERLLVSCDLKAFPILRFISEICEKITSMCSTARDWLARDEQFMNDVEEFIRETRNSTRQRERVLRAEKVKQKKVEKNVKVAHSILRSNRNKLGRIEAELGELEHQLNASKEVQRVRLMEVQHKEVMADFLKVTLQQTRKNCRLQNKRTRILRQVRELEQYLKLMETALEVVQDQILVKSHEKILLADKINTSEKSYGSLKSDLDRFSENLEELEAEVSGLSGQLLQLEIVHTIRTSPEILDNLTDRPSSVKLSKSLKDRIKQKVKKAVAISR